MNKPVYLGLSILDLSKTVMYEFWYDYIKPKHGEKARLCYINANSFIIYVRRDGIYKGIAEDVERKSDTLNYELNRPLPKGKNKNVIGLMKDELGGMIIKKIFGRRAKTCSNLIDDGSEDKKENGTKKCIIKRKLKFEDYQNCLEATQNSQKNSKIKIDVDSLKNDHKEFIKNNKLILKIQQRFRSERHNVFTEEVNKIALSANDDKRIQSIDSIETYAYGASKKLICKKEESKCNNIIKQHKNH